MLNKIKTGDGRLIINCCGKPLWGIVEKQGGCVVQKIEQWSICYRRLGNDYEETQISFNFQNWEASELFTVERSAKIAAAKRLKAAAAALLKME